MKKLLIHDASTTIWQSTSSNNTHSEPVRTYIYTNDVIIYLTLCETGNYSILINWKGWIESGLKCRGLSQDRDSSWGRVGHWICMWHAYGFQISLRASPASWLKLECHLMSRASLIFLGQNLSSVVSTSLWNTRTMTFSEQYNVNLQCCAHFTDEHHACYMQELLLMIVMLYGKNYFWWSRTYNWIPSSASIPSIYAPCPGTQILLTPSNR